MTSLGPLVLFLLFLNYATSFCSPSHAERQVPVGGHRCQHIFPLERDCPAAAPEAAHVPSPGGCRRPAPSRTESAADTGASRSSDAARNAHIYLL